MKILGIWAAIAAVISAPANAAITVPVNANGTPDLTVVLANAQVSYFTGSSAATPFLEEALRTECDVTHGSPIYKFISSTAAEVYICSKADSVTNFSNTFLVLHKRDGGGSINGVKNALGTYSNFVDMTSATTVTSCSAAKNSISTCTGGNVTISATAQQADVGLADVDAAQFASPLNGGVAGTAGVTNIPIAVQIFGIVVSLNLRNAMQAAEAATGMLPSSCASGASKLGSVRETEDCMPNLTSNQVSTILANNNFTDWTNLTYSGNNRTVSVYDASGALDTAAPANSNIHICARTAGSGTWAIANIKFENAPCSGDSQAFQTASSQTLQNETAAAVSGAQKLIHSMRGAGDVDSCLSGLSTGANIGTFTWYTTGVQDNVNGTNNSRYAIGPQGTDRNTDLSNDYRFIKIDNASPSAYNIVAGRWTFFAELIAVSSSTIAYPPANLLAADLLRLMSQPAHIANLNALTFAANKGLQTWGKVAGFMSVAPNYRYPATNLFTIDNITNTGYDPAYPVSPYTHSKSNGAALNHCRRPALPGSSVSRTATTITPAFYPTY